VAAIVAQLRTLSGHVFWPDDISPVGAEHIDAERIRTVKGGKAALHLIANR
jgi:hypothetical protein